MNQLQPFWTYLNGSPLFALVLTLLAYLIGVGCFRAARRSSLVNPIVVAVIVIVTVLSLTHIGFEQYFAGAQFIHFLLGPATVALAVPLYRQWRVLRRAAPVLLSVLALGSTVAVVLAVGTAWALGASRSTLLSIAPKSVTAPVAMGIADRIGGKPALSAVLVLLTGIIGTSLGPLLMNRLKLTDWRARGFAIGLAAHGMGTGRAMSVNAVAGAFAGLAMGLNALLTALVLPLAVRLVG